MPAFVPCPNCQCWLNEDFAVTNDPLQYESKENVGELAYGECHRKTPVPDSARGCRWPKTDECDGCFEGIPREPQP